ncbi:MAG TPA: hypothetical protein VGF79_02700 [Bacteroidia bacterium]
MNNYQFAISIEFILDHAYDFQFNESLYSTRFIALLQLDVNVYPVPQSPPKS